MSLWIFESLELINSILAGSAPPPVLSKYESQNVSSSVNVASAVSTSFNHGATVPSYLTSISSFFRIVAIRFSNESGPDPRIAFISDAHVIRSDEDYRRVSSCSSSSSSPLRSPRLLSSLF